MGSAIWVFTSETSGAMQSFNLYLFIVGLVLLSERITTVESKKRNGNNVRSSPLSCLCITFFSSSFTHSLTLTDLTCGNTMSFLLSMWCVVWRDVMWFFYAIIYIFIVHGLKRTSIVCGKTNALNVKNSNARTWWWTKMSTASTTAPPLCAPRWVVEALYIGYYYAYI